MPPKAKAPDDTEKGKSKEVRFAQPTFNPDQIDGRVEFMSPLSLRECIRRLEGKSSPADWKGDRVWQTRIRQLSPGRYEFHIQRDNLLKLGKMEWISTASAGGILQYWDDKTTLVVYGLSTIHNNKNILRNLAPFSLVAAILLGFLVNLILRARVSTNDMLVIILVFGILIAIPGLVILGIAHQARRTDSQKLADLIGELLRV